MCSTRKGRGAPFSLGTGIRAFDKPPLSACAALFCVALACHKRLVRLKRVRGDGLRLVFCFRRKAGAQPEAAQLQEVHIEASRFLQ